MRWLLALTWSLVLPSCSTVKFYAQAIHGQAQILHRARPIPEVIAAPETRPALRQRLRLVTRMREFAGRDLRLPTDRIFTRYSDLKRRYVVWVVYAARELSLEPKTWHYPLLGSLKYRGYFDEASARKEKDQLKAEGWDVVMSGVEAYSTLGWFRDPVLNTYIGRDEGGLAEILFHELTHARLFLRGDTDFNEALATAVGREGAKRWLAGRPALRRQYEQSLAQDDEIIRLLMRTREELDKVYHTRMSDDGKRAAKARCLAVLQARYQEVKRRWHGDSRYDRFFAVPVNNARLNTIAAYHVLVPAFARRIEAHGGDLEAFFHEMESLRGLGRRERYATLGEPPPKEDS